MIALFISFVYGGIFSKMLKEYKNSVNNEPLSTTDYVLVVIFSLMVLVVTPVILGRLAADYITDKDSLTK